MVMKMEIQFAKPLDYETKTRVLLAVSALAKSERIRFTQGGRCAVVRGEAMSVDRVRNSLEEQGVIPEQIVTSLQAELDTIADEATDAVESRHERFRPIGR